MALIKRYPNRKLYDTAAKRYITLDQITELIRQGEDIQVVDHESGEELTNTVLTQIILEQEKKQNGFLPRSLLTGLIRAGGDRVEQMRHSLQGGLEGAFNLAEGNLPLDQQLMRLLEGGKFSLEQVQTLLHLDERIAAILHHLNVPTQDEVEQLRA